MIIRAIRKINADAKVTVRGDNIDTCEIEWLEGTTPISKEDIKAQIPAAQAEEDQEKQDYVNNRTSGKAKLKTGEALTDAEVEALFG